MSSSFQTKSILSQQNFESLVSSGAQKAIKELGQGGGGEGKITAVGEWGGHGDNLFPHVSTPLWYHLAEPYVPFVTLDNYPVDSSFLH